MAGLEQQSRTGLIRAAVERKRKPYNFPHVHRKAQKSSLGRIRAMGADKVTHDTQGEFKMR